MMALHEMSLCGMIPPCSHCLHCAPRSVALERGHLRTKMVPQGSVASLRRYAMFAQIISVETAAIDGTKQAKLGQSARRQGARRFRPTPGLTGRRPQCFRPRGDPPGARRIRERLPAPGGRIMTDRSEKRWGLVLATRYKRGPKVQAEAMSPAPIAFLLATKAKPWRGEVAGAPCR